MDPDSVEEEELVDAYWRAYHLHHSSARADRLEADSLWWASESVTQRIERRDPNVVGLILALVEGANGDTDALCYLGAGPLEDLFNHYGPPTDATAAALEDEARRVAHLREALRCVIWGDEHPELEERFGRFIR